VGMMTHALGADALIRTVSRGVCDPADFDALLPRLLAFTAAGMRSPVVMENKSDETNASDPVAAGPVRAE
jgi:hypothetical protein